jgi:twitching motility two-component system response regulator PilG
MTTTTKLNPTELLPQLAESNNSGCLEVVAEAISWKIYLHQGKFKHIRCSVQLLEQLKYHLYQLGFTEAITALKQLPPSLIKDLSPGQSLYSKVISWLLAENHLSVSQGVNLIEHVVQDEIQYCLMLDRGNSFWHDGESLPAWIPLQIQDAIALDVSECLQKQQDRLRQWQNCSQKLLSVHQRPYFAPSWNQKQLPAGALNLQTLEELTKVLKGRTSIRQLSILLKKDELQVAQILSPYIDEKIIYLHHAQAPLDKLPNIPRTDRNELQSPLSNIDNARQKLSDNSANSSAKTWKIVCIDDSPTILGEIKRFLGQDKYEVTAIDDPVQAVSQVFKIEPDLILLDITMPRINGYKLCGLLRSSGKCNDTPIIMVTGNTGIIDKARSKLSGATDYFTKPFTKKGLMEIVEKYLD